jgi:flagellar hook-associated protein 1
MGDITTALRTAQSGLLSNQQALNTVSNNVANVNTEGYSRKIVSFESVAVGGVGAGVQISQIRRSIDEGLLKSLRIEFSNYQETEVKESFYSRMQNLFGSPGDNSSISHLIEKFAEATELLAVSPDQTAAQSELVRRASDIVTELHAMSTTIQELRLQTDQDIAAEISVISKITARVDTLNDEIIANSAVGTDVTDLKDQRDTEIDKLAKIIDIAYFSRSDGDVVIFTRGGRTLVDTVPPTVAHTSAATLSATSTHDEGDISGIYIGTQIASNDITDEIRGGNLKGLIDLRDTILPDLQYQIDQLAAQLRDTVNQIHNRGTPFPGVQEMTGTRQFISSSTQTIKLGSSTTDDDVAILLFDSTGDQSVKTTLKTIMQDTTLGDGADKGGNSFWTIDEIAARMEDWLQANGASAATVSVNSSGKFAVALNTTTLNLAFRDETLTTNGSTAEDVSIAFDSNGDGVSDETFSGFSNFLGLNDFFTDNLADNIWESDVLASSYTTPGSSQTVTIRDSTGSLGSITVTASTSLADLATQITSGITNVTAAVITDGSGVRLRISHDQGSSITVTQASGNTVLTDAGIDVADIRLSGVLEVRSDILSTPGKISTALPKWDSSKGPSGEYLISVGDDTIVQSLATAMATKISFKQTGGLASLTQNFSEYAGSILSNNASLAGENENQSKTQRALVESLQFKSDSKRGVNVDEEMANLLLFEQAFSAAARIISVIQNMMDALERAVQ